MQMSRMQKRDEAKNCTRETIELGRHSVGEKTGKQGRREAHQRAASLRLVDLPNRGRTALAELAIVTKIRTRARARRA